MNKDDYLAGIDMMINTGGSFAQHIGRAAICADNGNWARLSAAFEPLFNSYQRQAAVEENRAIAKESGNG